MNPVKMLKAFPAALSLTFMAACAPVFHPPNTALNLSPGIERTTVELPGVDPGKAAVRGFRLTEMSNQPGAVFVSIDDKGFVLASGLTKIAAVLDLEGRKPRNAFVLPGIDAVFVLHDPPQEVHAGEWEVHLSRFDLSTGRPVWTSSAGVHDLFKFRDTFIHDITTLGPGVHSAHGGYGATLLNDGRTLLLYGLVGAPDRPRVRLARLDVATGAVTSDEWYAAVRRVSDSQALFIALHPQKDVGEQGDIPEANLGRVFLKLVDLKTGETRLETSVLQADLPIAGDRISPFDYQRESAGSPFLCEVWPLGAGHRLYISSRCSANSGFGNSYRVGPLIAYDLKSPQAGPEILRDLHPALDTSLPAAWQGWPKAFPDLKPGSLTMVSGLFYIVEDGGFIRAPLPAEVAYESGRGPLLLDFNLAGMSWLLERERAWVLIGKNLYCVNLKDGTLLDSGGVGDSGLKAREKIENALRLPRFLAAPYSREMLERRLRDRASEVLNLQNRAGGGDKPAISLLDVDIGEAAFSKEHMIVPGRFKDGSGVLLVVGPDLLKDPPDVLAMLPAARLEGKASLDSTSSGAYIFLVPGNPERGTVITFRDRGHLLVYRFPLVLVGPDGVNKIDVEGKQGGPVH